MKITDPGFQDFRSDATCLIRPQSLIGEKFVDCRPTLPRAPGSPPAPPLKQIPSGQPGAGQYLLPLENNSTSVDPDLINDIHTLPYAQRFRLIFNELGAGLAGRGADIEEAVKRANPALRDADRLLGILNAQRDQLAQLAADSEQILGPLSRERAARRRLLRQRRRRRPGDRRTRRRPGSLAAASSPPSCASSAPRCAACRASPTPPRRSSPTSARRRPRSPKRPATWPRSPPPRPSR